MTRPNDELVELFRELVQLTILDEGGPQTFRVRAYENAMHRMEDHPGDLSQLTRQELMALDGIGNATAKKITEYFASGRIAKLDELRAKYPPEYVALSRIPGLGAKTLARLRSALGVESVDDLRAAIEAKRIRELRGLGEKTEEKLARAIERLGLTGEERRSPIAEALPLARRIVAALEATPEVE